MLNSTIIFGMVSFGPFAFAAGVSANFMAFVSIAAALSGLGAGFRQKLIFGVLYSMKCVT